MNDVKNEIKQLIDAQTVCSIASIDENGYPACKSVYTRDINTNDTMQYYYFSTSLSSKRAKHYLNNSKACIYFNNDLKGVMLQGIMEILQDLESKQKLWRESDIQYYKGGIEDLNYCVFKFTAKTGRYYYCGKTTDFIITSSGIEILNSK